MSHERPVVAAPAAAHVGGLNWELSAAAARLSLGGNADLGDPTLSAPMKTCKRLFGSSSPAFAVRARVCVCAGICVSVKVILCPTLQMSVH